MAKSRASPIQPPILDVRDLAPVRHLTTAGYGAYVLLLTSYLVDGQDILNASDGMLIQLIRGRPQTWAAIKKDVMEAIRQTLDVACKVYTGRKAKQAQFVGTLSKIGEEKRKIRASLKSNTQKVITDDPANPARDALLEAQTEPQTFVGKSARMNPKIPPPHVIASGPSSLTDRIRDKK